MKGLLRDTYLVINDFPISISKSVLNTTEYFSDVGMCIG